MMKLLNNLINGKIIEKFDILAKSKLNIKNNIDLNIVFPLKVSKVANNGKLSWIIFVDENGKKYWFIQTYGLKGGWNKTKNQTSKFSMTIYNGVTLYYNDKVNYGNQLFTDNQADFDKKLKERGFNLSRDDFTFTEFHKIINKLRKNTNICVFLMNQKYISGIGNILKVQILYSAGISPNRIISKYQDENNPLILTTKELSELHAAIIKVYNDALNKNGGTFKYCDLIEKTKCTYECTVYNKKIDPDGNKVICEKTLDKRKTYWVKEIQNTF